MKKVFEPVTKTLEDVSEDVTKAVTENSEQNNKALANLNDKRPEILNDRAKIASYLLSLLSKITNLEHSNGFNLKCPQSNRVNDLLQKQNNTSYSI